VAQMEQVVQQNASLAEEASAATESMKLQSAALLQAVSRFKLNQQQRRPGGEIGYERISAARAPA
jgi:hypothetical protein